jgi:TPR repeat protein
MGFSNVAFAELKALAAKGIAEDADYGPAISRECLLNEYRKRFRDVERLVAWGESAQRYTPWTADDLEGLQWIDALAQAGHVAALRLRGRVYQARNRLVELLAVAPAALHGMAEHAPPIARFLAEEECRSATPNREAVLRWLDAGTDSDRKIAAGVRELVTVAADMAPPDWKIVRTYLQTFDKEHVVFRHGERVEAPADLVWSFAKYRVESDDGSKHPAGVSLVKRAAALGSTRARIALWSAQYEAAADKRAFLESWFAQYPGHFKEAEQPCVELAASLERGEAGAAPDFEAAMVWYQRATAKTARHAYLPEKLEPDFCHWVAHALDRRWKRCLIADDALAMRWHERAFAVGDERCLDAWLTACANGEMTLPSDPVLAEEHVRRYCGSGVDLKPRKWRLATGVRAMLARAEALLAQGDAAAAARWLVVGTLLDYDEPQFQLAALALQGRGVKQDAAIARSLYVKASAQGHEGAKRALAAMQDGR